MSAERTVEQEVEDLMDLGLRISYRETIWRLVTARREAEAKLAKAEQEIRDHAEWAREYGKTPDGQAHLAWAKKLAEAERQRDEARAIALEYRRIALANGTKAMRKMPTFHDKPFPWEAP